MHSAPSITGIILAAGASVRMGTTKALLSIGSETFVSRSARTMIAGGADAVVVVASVAAFDIRAALANELQDPRVSVLDNPDWKAGQLTSLLVGLDAAANNRSAAVLVCPVDIPLFSASTVTRLIEVFRTTRAPLVRPASAGRHGHPVLFARAIFDAFRGADPSEGARPIVRAYAASGVDVEVDDPGAFLDIDTPDDYARWIAGRTPEAARRDGPR